MKSIDISVSDVGSLLLLSSKCKRFEINCCLRADHSPDGVCYRCNGTKFPDDYCDPHIMAYRKIYKMWSTLKVSDSDADSLHTMSQKFIDGINKFCADRNAKMKLKRKKLLKKKRSSTKGKSNANKSKIG